MTALTTSIGTITSIAANRSPNAPLVEGFTGTLHDTISRDSKANDDGVGNSCAGVTNATNKTSYFNNADKIAPYSITDASILSKINGTHFDNHDNDINDVNIQKDTVQQQQIFEQELITVIQEILPPSFWEVGTITNDNGKNKSFHEIHKKVPSFLDSFEIKSMEGGLSNHLFTVTNKLTDETVLVRIHPSEEEQKVGSNIDNTDSNSKRFHEQEPTTSTSSIIDREKENKIASYLSKNNIGPKFYGRFRNGRIEEFYNNHKTLKWNEMSIPRYARGIAIQLSNFHSVDMEKELFTSETRTDEKDNYNDDGDIWSRIENWLHTSKKLLLLFTNKNDNNLNGSSKRLNDCEKEILSGLICTIEKEWRWYKEEMKKEDMSTSASSLSIEQMAVQFCRQIVFTHMDCQSLNILTPIPTSSSDTEKSTAIVRLIDFEYSGFNRRAIDIANTFLEHCDMNNLTPSYEGEYPSVEEQNLFLMSYVRQCWSNCQIYKSDSSNRCENNVETYLRGLFSCDDNNDEHMNEISVDMRKFIDAVRNEVTAHTLFSHLEWSCWSIIQSMHSTIDFNYVKYAKLRLEGYFYFKNVAWKSV